MLGFGILQSKSNNTTLGPTVIGKARRNIFLRVPLDFLETPGGYRSRLPWFVLKRELRVLFPYSYQVIRYDDGPLVTLKDPSDLELYVKQNSDTEVQRRREIRTALRALDGQKVYWPYRHVDVSTCLVRIRESALTADYRRRTRLSPCAFGVCGTKPKPRPITNMAR